VIPFARFILPAMEKAVASFQPDVVAVDQHAVAGAVVATRHGVRWASLAPQAMELTRPLRSLPRVEGWLRERLDAVWNLTGEPGPAPLDLRFSPHLVIGFTSPLLTGVDDLPPNCELVGPAVHRRLDAPPFDWSQLDPERRKVLVSVGTMSVDVATDFFARVGEAVSPLDLQVILNAPVEVVASPPQHVLVAPRLPIPDLLSSMDAVVGHGGLNTTVEALGQGLPLVLAPIRNDQPVIANQVVAAGAGLRVRFGRVTGQQLRCAMTSVLDDGRYRAGAARIRDSFPAEGGAAVAARHLAELAVR
jgi:UDP:flavonoid glycosyltransferase YjiC (YdhE family)